MLPIVNSVLRLVSDPQIRFSTAGNAWATMRAVGGDRKKDPNSGEWVDGDSTFVDVVVLDKHTAEHIGESDLKKGDSIIVSGEMVQREYEVEGQKRVSYGIRAREFGVSLRWNSVKLEHPSTTGAAPAASTPEQEDVPPW